MTLGQRIGQSAKIILTVLGVSTPYPQVNVKDITIHKHQNNARVTFLTENLINGATAKSSLQ